MPTIKLNASGLVIMQDGKPSCTCCGGCCDFEISGIGAFILAGPGPTGYFTIQNNCETEIIMTAYTGVGGLHGVPPIAIPAGVVSNRLVFFITDGGGEWSGSPFTITVEGCPVSATYYWPSDYTGNPPWL